ncbi:MAG TPA: protein kinase, partial [Vicinamibacteria bacterium]|nr:protein kinase [Vicinamibacteria bacterium]
MKQPGQHVGPYQIVTLLGCGAMGEVYRARDLRLRREVALKVLPEETVAEPSFAARFEEEARAVSAIDHPNVVAVHDVGRDGPTAWMALELVEGRTLRELV